MEITNIYYPGIGMTLLEIIYFCQNDRNAFN